MATTPNNVSEAIKFAYDSHFTDPVGYLQKLIFKMFPLMRVGNQRTGSARVMPANGLTHLGKSTDLFATVPEYVVNLYPKFKQFDANVAVWADKFAYSHEAADLLASGDSNYSFTSLQNEVTHHIYTICRKIEIELLLGHEAFPAITGFATAPTQFGAVGNEVNIVDIDSHVDGTATKMTVANSLVVTCDLDSSTIPLIHSSIGQTFQFTAASGADAVRSTAPGDTVYRLISVDYSRTPVQLLFEKLSAGTAVTIPDAYTSFMYYQGSFDNTPTNLIEICTAGNNLHGINESVYPYWNPVNVSVAKASLSLETITEILYTLFQRSLGEYEYKIMVSYDTFKNLSSTFSSQRTYDSSYKIKPDYSVQDVIVHTTAGMNTFTLVPHLPNNVILLIPKTLSQKTETGMKKISPIQLLSGTTEDKVPGMAITPGNANRSPSYFAFTANNGQLISSETKPEGYFVTRARLGLRATNRSALGLINITA